MRFRYPEPGDSRWGCFRRRVFRFLCFAILVTFAALSGEVAAQNPDRVFNLQFDSDGAPLTMVRVLAGATTQVTLTLRNPELLSAGEVVSITLSTQTVTVNMADATVTLTRDLSTARLTIAAAHDVASLTGRVAIASSRVEVNGSAVADARITGATTLRVEILLRRFMLAFVTPDGAPLEMAQVPIGGTTEVALELENPELLVGGEFVEVMLMTRNVIVSEEELTLTATTPRAVLMISVARDAVSRFGELRVARPRVLSSGGEVAANARVANLPPLRVEITPVVVVREFTLAFTTLDGKPLETARVRVDATTRVRLTLSGEASLGAGEMLPVDFAYAPFDGGVSVEPEGVVFTAENLMVDLTLTASPSPLVQPGTLTATAFGTLPDTLPVVPANLPIEIVPRVFSLAFLSPVLFEESRLPDASIPDSSGVQSVRDVIEVPLDGVIESLSVSVSITHTYRSDLRVTLISPSGRDVVLHSRSGASDDDLRETWNAVSLPALAGLLGMMNSLGDWTLTVGDYGDGDIGTLDAWSFSIGIADPRVLAGGFIPLRLRLSGVEQLAAGETLPIDFTYAPRGGVVAVPSPMRVIFKRGSTEADVTLSVAADATAGTLTAVPGVMPPNTRPILPASLPVEIVPREFTLAFLNPVEESRLPGTSIPDNSQTQSVRDVIRVSGDAVIESLSVSVLITHTFSADLRVTLIPPSGQEVVLHGNSVSGGQNVRETWDAGRLPALANLLGMSAQGDWTLTVGDYRNGDTGTLDAWSLSIETGALLRAPVLAGGSIPLRLYLLSGVGQLAADETLPIHFAYMYQGGGMDGGVAVSSPMLVIFERDKTEVDVTLSAAALAKTGTLTAGPSVTLPNTRQVTPALLPVEILPRELALAFTTLNGESLEAVRVQAGTTMQVRLTLSGDGSLGENETLAVSFAYTSSGVEVSSPSQVRFTAENSVVDLTLRTAVASTVGILMARIDDAVNATVAPASLAVEILPREFALVFTTLADERLETARVQAGATTQVRLTLSGDGSLGEDETLAVSFAYTLFNDALVSSTGVEVSSPTQVRFSAEDTEVDLTLSAVPKASSGTLTASVSGTLPDTLPNTLPIAPTNLSVEIVPREFTLVFTTLVGEPLEAMRLQAGTTTRVRLTLSGDGSLDEDETLEVSFVYTLFNDASVSSTGVEVSSPPQVRFSAEDTEVDLTLSTVPEASSGTLTASVSSALPNTLPIAPMNLSVEILPRAFALAFTTLDGEPLETARVQAGATTQVRLTLLGEAPLGEDETVTVNLAYDLPSAGVSVQETVPFTADGLVADLVLSAALDARSGILTASVSGALPYALPIAPTNLPVEILPREFALVFTTLDGEPLETARVPAGSTTEVALELKNPELLRDGESVEITLSPRTVAVSDAVLMLAATSPRIALTIIAAYDVASLDGEVSVVSARVRSGGATVANTRVEVEPATLPVEIAAREFTLVFTTLAGEPLKTARVQAFATTRVRLILSGEALLGEGEVLTVSFVYELPGGGVSVPEVVVFTAESLMAALTLNVSPLAQPGVLTASIEDAMNAVTTPTSLQVEILPREFALAFTTSDDDPLEKVQVQAGATTRVRLSLLGDASLSMDEMLSVSFVYAAEDGSTGADVTVRGDVSFSTTAIDLTLNAPMAAQPGTLTASIEDAMNAVTTPTSLQVEILPREFVLAFIAPDDGSLERVQVQAGATTRVRLSLLSEASLGADEMLVASFVYAAEDGSTDADVTVRGNVIFSTTSGTVIDLTLNAPVAARPGVLTARIEDAVNAMITPTSLQVEILPREFTLAFMPPQISIVPGSTETVMLVLENVGGLEAEEQVPVILTLPEGSSLTLSSTRFTFGRDTDTRTVELGVSVGATPHDETLQAMVSMPHGLANVDFVPAEVQVNVIDRRDFAWTFRSAETSEVLSTAVVVRGGSRAVLLSLEGARGALLAEEESVEVSLAFTDETGITVLRPALTFTSSEPTHSVILQAAATATLGRLVVMLTGTTPDPLPDATVVSTAELAVELVRGFTLVFTTLDDAPLRTVQAQAATTTQVRLNLSGAAPLGMDETLTVTFSYDPADGGVSVSSPMSVSFTEADLTADLTLSAAANARAGTLTASVSGALPDTLPIAPANLPVEILSREFALAFTTLAGEPLETARVQAGATTRVRLTLSGDGSLGADETLGVSFAYTASGVEVSSLAQVRFSAEDTEVDLTLSAVPEASPGTLTASVSSTLPNTRVAPATLPIEILTREFTLAFTTLAGEPLEMARVQAGATMQVRLTLSGDGSLGEDETLGVSFAYTLFNDASVSSTGVEVSSPTQVRFSAEDTEVDLTLSAVPKASSGTLTVSVSSTLPNTLPIAPTSLSVEIVPREFTLAFTTLASEPLEMVRLQAGATMQVRLTLSGDGSLGADETLGVSFVYTLFNDASVSSTGVEVSSPPQVRFSAEDTEVDLTLSTVPEASPGTLTASVSSALPNTLPIAPTNLRVEIVPREFALAFTTLDGESLETARVQAGATTQVRLTLLGEAPLSSGETVTVNLAYDSPSAGVSVQETVPFTADGLVADLVLSAALDAQSGILTASVSGALPYARPIAPTNLSVKIVPRTFALVFTTPDGEPLRTARVPAGSTAEVALELKNPELLRDGESVEITLSMRTVAVSDAVLMLAATSPRIALTITAAYDVASLDGEVSVASSRVLSGGATVANTRVDVAPETLPVKIVPREFTLAFTTLDGKPLEMARVRIDTTTPVRLTLSGEASLSEDEMLTVSFGYEPPDGGVSVEPEVVVFTAENLMDDLTLTASPLVRAGTLTATVSGTLPKTLLIASANLPIEIVPRVFSLAFLPSSLFEESRFPDALIPDSSGVQSVRDVIEVPFDAVIVSLSVYVSITHPFQRDLLVTLISPSGQEVVLHKREEGFSRAPLRETWDTANLPALADLVGMNALGDWTLTVGDYMLNDIGTLDEWNLSIEIDPRVLAGGSIPFRLRLSGVEQLVAGETLPIDFTYEPQGGGVDGGVVSSPMRVIFERGSTEATVTLSAAADAKAGTLTAVPGVMLPNTQPILPASLPVEIVPREFTLVFLNRVEESRLPGTLIPDNTQTQSVRDVIRVPVNAVIVSLSMSVSITHPFQRDLRVTLIVPSGEEVVLHGEAGMQHIVSNLNTVNLPKLANLLGTNALGDWTLTVGDYGVFDIGTLDAWSLSIETSALLRTPVLAGDSVPLRLYLLSNVGQLVAGETLPIDFVYAAPR